MNSKGWQKLADKFGSLSEHCKRIGDRVDIGLIAPTMIEAGKTLYDLSCSGNIKIPGIDEMPKFPDHVEVKTGNPETSRFGSYWFCNFVFFGKRNLINIGHPTLRSLFMIPIPIGQFFEKSVIDGYLKNKTYEVGYIQEICLGSQQLCRIFSKAKQEEKQKFNIPNTHMSSPEIEEEYGIYATTLSTWGRKAIAEKVLFFDEDKPLEDISSFDIVRSTDQGRPKCYPKWWAKEKHDAHEPKHKPYEEGS